MKIRNIEAKDYALFLNLYNETFPADERRIYKDVDDFARFIKAKDGKFNGQVYVDDSDRLMAFITYWIFEGYIYIEHFAVEPSHRGNNIGSKMLSHLIDTVGRDMVLEVEIPTDEITRRRVGFYQRNGFTLRDDIYYVQPPYSPEQRGLEMKVMTHGNVPLSEMSDLSEMHREVYNVE